MKRIVFKERINVMFILLFFVLIPISAQNKSIYHQGWIDFNKNGVKDVFEDPHNPLIKGSTTFYHRVKFILNH